VLQITKRIRTEAREDHSATISMRDPLVLELVLVLDLLSRGLDKRLQGVFQMADKCKYDLNVSEHRDTPKPKIEDEFEDDLVLDTSASNA